MRLSCVALLLACATAPCLAQATGAVLPSVPSARPGETVVVEVRLDVTATGQELGGYGAALAWDPAVLQYTVTTPGPFPFDTPVINASAAAGGVLVVADADAVGLPGEVTVFSASFQVVATRATRPPSR